MRTSNSLKRAGMVALSVCAAALVAACGGGGGGSAAPTNGTLSASLTDAPSCGYDHVYVTVQKLRVHQSASANANDAGWTDITLNPQQRIDLLSLNNGVVAALGQTSLTAGQYQQLRLVLAANGSTAPYANSVVPTGGVETPLTTPSAVQSGIKLNADVTVPAGAKADVLLDFDACHSIVPTGGGSGYLLNPVIAVTPYFLSSVSGVVDASIAKSTTTVSLEQSGTVIKSTAPDASGKFVLGPVAPGTYDLVVSSSGHATAVVTSVPVTANASTTVGSTTAVLAPPVSTAGTVAGAVTASPSPIVAMVAATQNITSAGHGITVTSTMADGTTGAYTLTLPDGAPVVAPYVAAPSSLVFAADGNVAGKYSIVATSGSATKSNNVAVTANATTTVNFAF